MKFRLESVGSRGELVYVLARQIEAGAFTLSERATLGGAPTRPFVSMPRALTPDGSPDLTVFVFTLVDGADAVNLEMGTIVELKE